MKTRAPVKRIRDPNRLRPHEGDARRMKVADFQSAIFTRIESLRGDMVDHIRAYLDAQSGIQYSIKESAKNAEWCRKAIGDFARRLADVERQVNDLRLTTPAAIVPAAAQEPRPAPAAPASPPRPAPLPAWRKETREAVDRIEKELPALSSIPELSAFFKVSPGQIRNAVLNGRLRVIRQGHLIRIPQEALCEYVRIYGLPRSQRLFYGSSRLAEFRETE
jgi:hypothetical protein